MEKYAGICMYCNTETIHQAVFPLWDSPKYPLGVTSRHYHSLHMRGDQSIGLQSAYPK